MRRIQVFQPETDRYVDSTIAECMWAFDEARNRTLARLRDLPERAVDWLPPGGASRNSIGTLLYHIALVEADWLYVEVCEQEAYAPEIQALISLPCREEEGGRLTPIEGVPLAEHLDRLARVRRAFVDVFATMDADDYRRPRVVDGNDVTPQWVVHHLLQHEAEHRGEIMSLRRAAEQNFAAR